MLPLVSDREGNYDPAFWTGRPEPAAPGMGRVRPTTACDRHLAYHSYSHQAALDPSQRREQRERRASPFLVDALPPPPLRACCGTFVAPGPALRRRPRELYGALLAVLQNQTLDDARTGRDCFEYIIYSLLGGPEHAVGGPTGPTGPLEGAISQSSTVERGDRSPVQPFSPSTPLQSPTAAEVTSWTQKRDSGESSTRFLIQRCNELAGEGFNPESKISNKLKSNEGPKGTKCLPGRLNSRQLVCKSRKKAVRQGSKP